MVHQSAMNAIRVTLVSAGCVFLATPDVALGTEPESRGSAPPKRKAQAKKSTSSRAQSAPPVIQDFMDPKVIRSVIHAHRSQIRACFEEASEPESDLSGRVVVRFKIVMTGETEAVEILSSTVESASVESCILAEVDRWSFPKPQGGIAVVEYPFLSSGEDTSVEASETWREIRN